MDQTEIKIDLDGDIYVWKLIPKSYYCEDRVTSDCEACQWATSEKQKNLYGNYYASINYDLRMAHECYDTMGLKVAPHCRMKYDDMSKPVKVASRRRRKNFEKNAPSNLILNYLK